MATYHVTNADEFINIITTVDDADAIIEIDNDIDFNPLFFDDANKIITAKANTGTINGNGHAIYNIQGSLNDGRNGFLNFYRVTINDLNFFNCAGYGGSIFFRIFTAAGIVFNRCQFQGLFSQLATGGTFNNCYFNLGSSSSLLFGSSNVYDSYFKFAEGCVLGSSPYASFVRCYLVGEVTFSSNTYFGGNNYVSNTQHSIINITSNSSVYLRGKTDSINLYNTDKLTGTVDANSGYVGVTDSQLKDASYLLSLGFPIIV